MSCTDSISGRFPPAVNASAAPAVTQDEPTENGSAEVPIVLPAAPVKESPETIDEFGFDSFCGITLRPVREDDLSFVEGLYLATTEPLLKALDLWDRPTAEARVARAMRHHPSRILCEDGVEVGWLQVSRTPSGFHLNQVHLLPPFRNRGLGSCMIGRILARAQETQCPVTLNVILGNPAIALYRRLGFRIVNQGFELVQMRWHPRPAEVG